MSRRSSVTYQGRYGTMGKSQRSDSYGRYSSPRPSSQDAERTEKQKQLGAKLMASQQKIDERVKKWQDLRQAAESLKHSSQNVLEENERIFTELMRALERRYTDVKEMIRAQEAALMTQAERHLDRMEEEITLLRMKHNDLEKLSNSDDHIHFLQSWQSLSAPSGYEDLSKVTLAQQHSFEKTKKAISELKVQLEDVSKDELSKISSAVREVQILRVLEPKTREDFLQYSSHLSLDPLTVHPNLHLAEGNTVVRMSNDPKHYPDHPERATEQPAQHSRATLTQRARRDRQPEKYTPEEKDRLAGRFRIPAAVGGALAGGGGCSFIDTGQSAVLEIWRVTKGGRGREREREREATTVPHQRGKVLLWSARKRTLWGPCQDLKCKLVSRG
ncbi:hypothetical protein MHYP_G00039510 [Metynnis hypsauchen]